MIKHQNAIAIDDFSHQLSTQLFAQQSHFMGRLTGSQSVSDNQARHANEILFQHILDGLIRRMIYTAQRIRPAIRKGTAFTLGSPRFAVLSSKTRMEEC